MRTKLAIAVSLAIASSQALALGATRFDEFTPLSASFSPAVSVGNEATGGIVLGTPVGSHQFTFTSIADRTAQIASQGAVNNTGSWDMITSNETGTDAGRYLFTVFETGSSGVQRTDLNTNTTQTVWQSPGVAPALNAHVAFDASYWTPWGTHITAEENWTTAAGGATTNPYGRLFELTNPTTAPSVTVAGNNSGADFFHRNVIPRVSHEGIEFDAAGHMYFIDELNGGSIYRYTTAADFQQVVAGTADYFAAGTTAVLQVGTGNVDNAVGNFSWVDFTDNLGVALAGALTITDPNGVTSVDARATTDLAAFKGTNYQRPEDMDLQISGTGDELLYVTTTTTNEVYAINLTLGSISVFANTGTIDLATGLAVDAGLRSPDNLAIDADGTIYVIEDRNGGTDNDIWYAKDINKDGDLTDVGEGLARWASNGIDGSEFTGLYFDTFNGNRAWVNIQHPGSGVDRTFEIAAVPVPAALPLLLSALGGLGFARRRK